MSIRRFSKKLALPVSSAEAFTWHAQKGAFARLTPPWEKIKILRYSGSIANGAQAELYCQLLGPIGFKWLLEHCDYIPEKQFCDQQVLGPFSSYRHSHLFSEEDDKTVLEDRIDYSLPISIISHRFAALLVDRRLERTFRYRHWITAQDLAFHSQYQDKPKLRFLVSGATGMIGRSLCAFLTTGGHSVTRIVRSIQQAEAGDIVLGPAGEVNIAPDCQFDCVVNLAGAGIADRRWTQSRMQTLADSRVEFTKNLVVALKKLTTPPKTMISGSAIGYYGDVKTHIPDETAARGQGFLAKLCEDWETAASAISDTGCRLVNLRIGAVLGASGGILKKMLVPFSLGLGCTLGDGSQQFGWVAIDDVLHSILFLSYTENISGAVNIVAPCKTSNLEFTKAFGAVLNRPTVFLIPAAALRLMFGKIADEVLLASSTAKPSKLTDAGFKFLFEDPQQAIEATLGAVREGGSPSP